MRFRKRLLFIAVVAILALSVTGVAYAAFAATDIPATGTVTILDDYSVSVSPSTLDFGAVSGTKGDPIATVNVGVTLTNDGSVDITGFSANCTGVTGLPDGLTLALTTASSSIALGDSVALNFALSGTPTVTTNGSSNISGNVVLDIEP